MITLYGLGTTIGAGIYALIGEIAGLAGYLSPLAFLIASTLAGFTALSFAELSSRFPRAAGAALYIDKGFGVSWFSTAIGLLVVAAGLVSAAALINGLHSHLQEIVPFSRTPTILIITMVLGLIAAWGISESVAIAAAVTVIEIGGLVLVIGVSGDAYSTLPDRWSELIPSSDLASWNAIFLGVTLSFYAFIGFEDMVDTAEEVINVKRNLPLAIILTLIITTCLYVLLALAAVTTTEPSQLAQSNAPLAHIFELNSGYSSKVLLIIGMFAIINGALIQMIMASRVLYGLSSRKKIHSTLSYVSPHTRTPLVATGVACIITLTLSLFGNLSQLAHVTSMIMLTVFSIVNLSLCKVKSKNPAPDDVILFPRWIPVTGFVVCLGVILLELSRI
jgi:amino acid transporter